jgi:predicted PurR-regulated permease PerM
MKQQLMFVSKTLSSGDGEQKKPTGDLYFAYLYRACILHLLLRIAVGFDEEYGASDNNLVVFLIIPVLLLFFKFQQLLYYAVGWLGTLLLTFFRYLFFTTSSAAVSGHSPTDEQRKPPTTSKILAFIHQTFDSIYGWLTQRLNVISVFVLLSAISTFGLCFAVFMVFKVGQELHVVVGEGYRLVIENLQLNDYAVESAQSALESGRQWMFHWVDGRLNESFPGTEWTAQRLYENAADLYAALGQNALTAVTSDKSGVSKIINDLLSQPPGATGEIAAFDPQTFPQTRKLLAHLSTAGNWTAIVPHLSGSALMAIAYEWSSILPQLWKQVTKYVNDPDGTILERVRSGFQMATASVAAVLLRFSAAVLSLFSTAFDFTVQFSIFLMTLISLLLYQRSPIQYVYDALSFIDSEGVVRSIVEGYFGTIVIASVRLMQFTFLWTWLFLNILGLSFPYTPSLLSALLCLISETSSLTALVIPIAELIVASRYWGALLLIVVQILVLNMASNAIYYSVVPSSTQSMRAIVTFVHRNFK